MVSKSLLLLLSFLYVQCVCVCVISSQMKKCLRLNAVLQLEVNRVYELQWRITVTERKR